MNRITAILYRRAFLPNQKFHLLIESFYNFFATTFNASKIFSLRQFLPFREKVFEDFFSWQSTFWFMNGWDIEVEIYLQILLDCLGSFFTLDYVKRFS